jgi:hypothetical protein
MRVLALSITVTLAGLQAQTPTPDPTDVVGTWRLVSGVQRLRDGTTRPDPQAGPHGVGYLIYTDNGRMCAMIANPDRDKWPASGEPSAAAMKSTLDGLVAYCGRYEVGPGERAIIHHIEFDKVPNLAGSERKRFYTLTGNRLVLRPASLPADVVDWTVEWERVPRR